MRSDDGTTVGGIVISVVILISLIIGISIGYIAGYNRVIIKFEQQEIKPVDTKPNF